MSKYIENTALLSECGLYRYDLYRKWDERGAPILWIMLNPSTADATLDDPTIRRCIGFSKKYGYGALKVVNLFAFRATKPSDLKLAVDPVGPNNDQVIVDAVKESGTVVCAWGTHGKLMDRDIRVMELISDLDKRPICLGITKDGHPRHPLYLKSDTNAEIFSIRRT